MNNQPLILQPSIQQRIEEIQGFIRNASQGQKVTLVAVSKMQSYADIIKAYDAGIKDFGENYLQEALNKQQSLNHLPIIWHFIGPIQSNKTQLIAQHFDWVQSVDREKIASRLSQARVELGKPPLSVCIQVNISKEDTKSGINIDQVYDLANYISRCEGLLLRGMMAIPSPHIEEGVLRHQFAKLKTYYEDLKKYYTSVDTLSMGMTNDYLIAIEEGANLVRIGTGIFGIRERK